MTVDIWKGGKKIGIGECDTIDGALVLKQYTPIILQMKADAKAAGVNLTLAVGIRTFEKQVEIRKAYAKDKSMVNDHKYIYESPSTNFSPLAAIPGTSNHGHGKAYDWNVTGHIEAYKWLVEHAFKYGMVRRLPSERWHWEIETGAKTMFDFVPKTDPSWDGLV